MELEVGMYIRNKFGKINKIIGYGGSNGCGKLYEYELDKYIVEGNILKASFNIIDLIEVGDYVNGKQVVEINEYKIKYLVLLGGSGYNHFEDVMEKDIKKIVTKEQFESMQYVVGGEK